MRALCEGCGKHQAPDWKAGDLCSYCGQAVRHDVRCYWCAKWVPAAKFCRSCGAVVVEERLYGAARMLKDAGTDRFTIPKQLKEFDPDQIENFSRIYQQHAVTVARHVDELRFLERYLFHKHWSADLEEELIPRLPWNEEMLARMSGPRPPEGDVLATVKAIEEGSPIHTTQRLASLVRIRLNDWSAYQTAEMTFHSGDAPMRAEAALALTGWRVLRGYGRPRDRDGAMVAELQKSTFKVEAAVRLGFLGRQDPDLLRDALASSDRETSFGAALVLGDVGRLQAALQGDAMERSAAGNRLIELGVIKPVVQIVEKSPLEVQQELVEALIRRKEPAPEAADTLMQIVETSEDNTLRERAARILCRELRPEWVLRIARKAGKERYIYQSLLQAPDLQRESALELGAFLVEKGHFRMSQYGLSTVAENGRMPASFVPAQFARTDDETRQELLRFAEVQLNRGDSEELHKFVMNVVFGAHPAKLRAAAWWVLHRNYRHHGEHRGEGPFKLQKEPVERFFGSFAQFLPKLTAVLGDHDTLKEVGYYEMMATLLTSADDEAIRLIQAEESAANDLVFALMKAMREDYWPNTLEAMVRLLARIAVHPRWRVVALGSIRALGKKGNYYHDKAINSLELAKHGMPEESEWEKLPDDWIPSRFEGVTFEGRMEMLRLAELQLRARKDPGLLRFLIRTAFQQGEPDVRTGAMNLFREYWGKPSQNGLFILTRETAEAYFDSLPALAPRLSSVLREPTLFNDRPFWEFFGYLLHPNVTPAVFEALVSNGSDGHELVRAAVAFLLDKDNQNLKHGSQYIDDSLLLLLTHVGADLRWRDEVLAALKPQQAALQSRLGGPVERLFQRLEPPPPPPPPPPPEPVVERHGPPIACWHGSPDDPLRHQPPPPPPPPPPRELTYEEKGKMAQDMGFELQRAMFALMAGPGSPDEKAKEAQRMSLEFQAKIKKLYNYEQ
jgi:hypothetical protein